MLEYQTPTKEAYLVCLKMAGRQLEEQSPLSASRSLHSLKPEGRKPKNSFCSEPKAMTACENRANFIPRIVQFDWLISDQLLYSSVTSVHFIALFYVFQSRTAQINPLLVLFSFLKSQK